MAKEMVKSLSDDQSGSGRKCRMRKHKRRKIVSVRRKLIKGRKRKTVGRR